MPETDLVEKIMSPTKINTFRFRTPINEGVKTLEIMDKDIIFNYIYDDWNYHRRFYSKILKTPQSRQKIVESSQSIFVEIKKYWKEIDEPIIDLSEWIVRFAFENIMYLTTNKRFNSIADYYNSLKPNTQPPLTEKLIGGAKKSLDSLVLEIVKKRREQIENSDVKEESSQDFLTQLLTINTKQDVTKEVRAFMTEILAGGSFTKIVKEIESILGKNVNKEITLNDLDNMKYCEAVISEENPNQFKPERFLDGEKINKNTFFMFGGGTRICP
ncbi:12142_t:CDS:2, partial [Dentiscutata erythropus]